jgi:hypothetical protein
VVGESVALSLSDSLALAVSVSVAVAVSVSVADSESCATQAGSCCQARPSSVHTLPQPPVSAAPSRRPSGKQSAVAWRRRRIRLSWVVGGAVFIPT